MNRDYEHDESIEYVPNSDDLRDVDLDEDEPSPPPTIDPDERIEEPDEVAVDDDERPA